MDKQVVEETQTQDSEEESHTDSEAPETSLAVDLVHEGVVEQETNGVATHSSDNEDADTDKLKKEPAEEKTKHNCYSDRHPSSPGLGVIREEGGVWDKHNKWEGDKDTHNEENRLEDGASHEANNEPWDQEKGKHGPFVVVEPLPDSTQLSILATSLAFERANYSCSISIETSSSE